MATTKETVDFILDQVQGAGALRARKMFGEYALYCDEKVVALVCDEQLFVKITPISDSYLGSEHQAPPYLNAKNWLKVGEERLEEREWLTDFIRQTAAALPKPKPKKKKLKTNAGNKKTKNMKSLLHDLQNLAAVVIQRWWRKI